MIDRACISLNEICNLNCSYCHFSSRLTHQKQLFSIDEIKKVIDNIAYYVNELPFKLGLVGAGEPILFYHLIENIIHYIKQKKYNNISCYIITNGTLLDIKKIRFFYEHQEMINLCFSLDGYEELHNIGREKYKETFDAIKLYEKFFNKKPSINCTVHKYSIKNKEKLFEYFNNNSFHSITFSRLVDSYNANFAISLEEFNSFLLAAQKYKFSSRNFLVIGQNKIDCTMYGAKCGVGRTNIFITKKGIYPCGRFYNNDKYLLGKYDTPLYYIEKNQLQYQDFDNNKCYYDNFIRGNEL